MYIIFTRERYEGTEKVVLCDHEIMTRSFSDEGGNEFLEVQHGSNAEHKRVFPVADILRGGEINTPVDQWIRELHADRNDYR